MRRSEGIERSELAKEWREGLNYYGLVFLRVRWVSLGRLTRNNKQYEQHEHATRKGGYTAAIGATNFVTTILDS